MVACKNNDYYPNGLSWIKTPIKILGIVITTDFETNYIHNFQQGFLNFKSILNIWKQRKLSLKVKITIHNNLALSPLIYASSVVYTPSKAINEINNLIQAFIWNNYTSKIAQNTLTQKIEKGKHRLLNKETIPKFYSDIHNLYMKDFKKTPTNLIPILNQSLWLNENLKINNTYLYSKYFIDKGILYIKDSLDNNGNFLNHLELTSKYKLITNFMECL